MTKTIKVECSSCRGTGLYRGFAEPPGVAVVCLKCGGDGCSQETFVEFNGRRERTDVTTVKRSRGTFIGTGVGPAGDGISYAEFLRGRLP